MPEDINGYDEWKTRIPVEVVVGECEHCGAEIYMDNEHYRTNQGRVCEECFQEFAEGFLEAELVSGIEGVLDY